MLFDKFNRPLELIEILAGDDPAESRCVTTSGKSGNAAPLFPSEHIVTFMKVMAALGLRKALLAGKEPLSRADIVDLVSGLAALRPKMEIIIRTASPLLAKLIKPLITAGAREIRAVLPSVDPLRYSSATGLPAQALADVMEGLRLGKELGAEMVVETRQGGGVDLGETADVALWAISNGYPVRILEGVGEDAGGFMDWTLGRISQVHPLESGPSRYLWKAPAAGCSLEFITTSSQKNCQDCRRLWLSADGKIKLCNHHHEEHDLGELFEERACGAELLEFAAKIPLNKPQGYFLRNC